MCGIVAVYGNPDERLVREMMDRIRHRGPDGSGLNVDPGGHSGLGHRRLAIVDPAGGQQPLFAECGSAVIVNGEVYNHRDIRTALPDARFRTGSDSEAILQLYLRDKQGAVSQLDGMYAFILRDGDDLYVGRDPLGIKPLYMGRRGGGWCFASEIKALLGFADDIAEFPPGTTFHTARGFERFYEVPDDLPEDLSADQACSELLATLERAVVKRLMSDGPVGVLLSGGLDSSAIAAIARRHVDQLHTFAVGVEGSPDLEAARHVATVLGTTHHEYVLSIEEVVANLFRILYHLESFDQDLVRSGVPCYFAAQLAAEHVKVVLTGEGADELFAGYSYYKRYVDPAALHAELRRSVCGLHNINLQRLDRLTMAHGIEGRVPFLDLELVSLAQRIAPQLKLRAGDRDGVVEKWVLRKACQGLLPDESVWREKQQFDQGSGTVGLLSEALDDWTDRPNCERYRRRHPETRLRSEEECVYHALLATCYAHPEPVLANVARWSEQPAARGADWRGDDAADE